MTASSADRGNRDGSWRWPVDPARYDRTSLLRAAEKDAIVGLGLVNLRRLARHDPAARGWQEIRRLLRPLDAAASALEGSADLSPAPGDAQRGAVVATAVRRGWPVLLVVDG